MIRLILSTTFALGFLTTALLPAAEVRVTKEGGTPALLAALKKAEERAKPAETPMVITIEKGIYRLDQPLEFDARHSHLVIKGDPAKSVVLSGGRMVSGWKEATDGTWRAPWKGKAAPRELFSKGKRATRARTPIADYFKVEKTFPDRRTGFIWEKRSPNEENLKPQHLATTELVFFHDWSISRVGLKAIDLEKRSLTTSAPIGCAANHYSIDHFEKNPRFYLEGDIAFLDEEGEWCHDPGKGELVYKPLKDEIFEDADLVVPLLDALATIKGTREAPVTKLAFEGLRFENCRWELPVGGYASGQATIHEVRPEPNPPKGIVWEGAKRVMIPAAVRAQWITDCHWANCSFRHLGTSGLWLGEGASKSRISKCHFEDISGNGLMMGNLTNSNDHARITSGVLVEDSLFDNCGAQFFGSVGIWAGITRHCTIEFNELTNLPYTGISSGWVWNPSPTAARAMSIRRNHIHSIMSKLSDGGGIYTLGFQPESVIEGNHIAGIPLNAGRADSNGIFMDQGSKGFVVRKNLIYDLWCSPVRFNQAGSNEIRENLLCTETQNNYKTAVKIPSNTSKEGIVIEDNEHPDLDAAFKKGEKWTAGPRDPNAPPREKKKDKEKKGKEEEEKKKAAEEAP